jgi:hypothetical protein
VWTYNQSNGWLDKDGILVSKTCYSGFGEGLNNPEKQAVLNEGPIPCGLWTISGPPFDGIHGPYCLRLSPQKGTQTFGRTGFLVHGDEREHPGEHLASHGCIIMDRVTRERVYQSGDVNLEVVSGIVYPDVTGEISV